MSTKMEIVVCRASYRKVFSAIFRRVSFSTATGHVTSLRFCFAFFGLAERYGDVSTSLTTSAMSRGTFNLFLQIGAHLSVCARALVTPREITTLASIIFVSNRMARAPFLHHCGGVTHQTSLRSRSIMMCYANSPPWWGGG